MTTIRKLGGCDRVSIGLLPTALVSLSAALAVVPHRYPSAIPDRFLDRVRGANPNFHRTPGAQPNCTTWNIFNHGGTQVPGYQC